MKTSFTLLAFTLLLPGCSLKPHWPDTEASASAASGFANAIAIRVVGEPDDKAVELPKTLSVQVATQTALQNDPAIQSALSRVQEAYAEAWQARLWPNPMINVVLRFPESGGPMMVEAGLAADLLSLLQKPGRVSAADHRLRAASAEAVTVVLDALAQVQSVYVSIQAAEGRLTVLEQRREIVQKLGQLAESRLKAGEGTLLDVTTLQAQSAELEVEITESRLARRELRFQLARILGNPSRETDWPLEVWKPTTVQFRGDGGLWVKTAWEKRPEMQARWAEVAALGADMKLARLAFFEGSEAGVMAERDGGEWSVGPSFSSPLPLFDWGQAKSAKAKARLNEAWHELTRIHRQVAEEVFRAFASLAASREAMSKVNDRLLPLLERRREQAEAAYKAGQSDIIPVLMAEQELQAGRAKLVELEEKSLLSLIRLHRAVGGPGVAEQNSTPNAP